MYSTSTPKAIKGSENASSKTVSSKLLKLFKEDHRKNILMKAAIVVADIAPKEIAMEES